MKLFTHLCGIILFGLLGYSLEPNLRFQLTGIKPTKLETAGGQKIILRLGEGQEDIDLETLTPEQLPYKVLISASVTTTDSKTGITMIIPAGNEVKLIRIDRGNAVVSPLEGSFIGKIPVNETDLIKQLSENPPVKGKPATTPAPVVPAPAIPTQGESADPPNVPEPPPVPSPAPLPEPVPTPEPTPMPEPAPTPEPIPPVEPVTPATPTTAGNATPADVVKVMQTSVQGGQIKEFKFDQVTEWKAGEAETVDGQSFATGTALYKAVTFLGEKSIEAKAFIKDGKVQRWIWPRSGMEIK